MDLWKDLFSILESAFTTIGIIVGGVWTYRLFIRKREDFPKLEISLIPDEIPLSAESILVHVELKLENKGNVIFKSNKAELRLRQVVPVPEDLKSVILEGYDPVKDGRSEIEWPMIAGRNWKWDEGDFEIEPGESDSLHADFVIPSTIEVCEFYAYIFNLVKRPNKLGWPLTKIYRFNKADEGEQKMAKSKDQTIADVQKHNTRQQKPQEPQKPKQPKPPKKKR